MTSEWIEIDGSQGEGGGQMLRSSLALSILTGRPVRFVNLRARREKPGLQPQHLMSVLAAADICGATVKGAELKSQFLSFVPGPVVANDYHFHIGTAGSTLLVLHTIYLPLILRGDGPSTVWIEGGTHNDKAPSLDFVTETWVKHLKQLGLPVTVKAERLGFYPRGGGRIVACLDPAQHVQALQATETLQSSIDAWEFTALLAGHLPEHIGERMVQRVRERLGDGGTARTVIVANTLSPGVAATLVDRRTPVPSTFVALGERGKRAERVADEAIEAYLAHRDTGRPIDPHSADQLVLPLAVADGPSAYAVSEVTQHLLTNLEIVKRFINRTMACEGKLGEPGIVRIEGTYQLPRGPVGEDVTSGPEPDQERTMPDEKRRLREEKRIIKRAGQKHARREVKRALRDDPDNAHDVGMDFGRWSTEKRKQE
jgi:RNA 3'-terminal phosphate cyclase (ATP)